MAAVAFKWLSAIKKISGLINGYYVSGRTSVACNRWYFNICHFWLTSKTKPDRHSIPIDTLPLR